MTNQRQRLHRQMCIAAAHEELRTMRVPAGFGITADDCDGSHYEREAQDAIERQTPHTPATGVIAERYGLNACDVGQPCKCDVDSWLTPWREWHEG